MDAYTQARDDARRQAAELVRAAALRGTRVSQADLDAFVRAETACLLAEALGHAAPEAEMATARRIHASVHAAPTPAPDRAPRRRHAASGPIAPKSGAQALHLSLVREGFRTESQRYALASEALGRAVTSFSALTPAERNAVRDAAFTAYA